MNPAVSNPYPYLQFVIPGEAEESAVALAVACPAALVALALLDVIPEGNLRLQSFEPPEPHPENQLN